MNTKPHSVLVTGCAGFIGSNFTRAFAKKFPRIPIIGIDDLSTGRRDALITSMKFYEGSICDEKLLDTIFKKHKPKYVFHFAALPRISFSVKYLAKTTETNVLGTTFLLEKSRDYGVKRFIFSSSSSVYGNLQKMPLQEDVSVPGPVSPYAFQKYAGEYLCKLSSELYKLDTVCLRYFTVFGPGQYGDSPYATVISAWLTGMYFPSHKELFIEGNGKQSRDFCYVDNVIQANLKAMRAPKRFHGAVFNIAHGERRSLISIKRLIEKYTKRKLNLKKRPPRKGDVAVTHAHILKAKKSFGYEPVVSFDQGLRETIAWFQTLESNNNHGKKK